MEGKNRDMEYRKCNQTGAVTGRPLDIAVPKSMWTLRSDNGSRVLKSCIGRSSIQRWRGNERCEARGDNFLLKRRILAKGTYFKALIALRRRLLCMCINCTRVCGDVALENWSMNHTTCTRLCNVKLLNQTLVWQHNQRSTECRWNNEKSIKIVRNSR